MRTMFVITLMGIAIVGGTGVGAVAGETKAKMEKAKGEMKGRRHCLRQGWQALIR